MLAPSVLYEGQKMSVGDGRGSLGSQTDPCNHLDGATEAGQVVRAPPSPSHH